MPHGAVQHTYLIGKENTWGAGGTLSYDVGIVTDVDKSISRETIIAQGIGDIEAHSNHSGVEEGTHTVTLQFQHGRIFDFIIGAASHQNTSSDTEHTFTVSDNPLSFAAETGSNISAGDVGFNLYGQMIESAELSIENNGLLMLSFTARGKAPLAVDSTISAHSTSTLPVFPSKLVTISLNGTAADFIQNFRVSFRKTLTPTDGVGTVQHLAMTASDLRIEFSGTLGFDDSTFHTHAISNNLTAITFVADNGTSLGSGKRGLNLALNDIEISSFRETARVGSLTFVEISGIAKLNTLVTTDNITSANWFT